MAALLSFADAVDIGHGRGRLAAPAAASLARVDAALRDAFGRYLDVNEAWRSPEKADENYRAYQAYLRGGPWAPLALAAKDSIHCRGYALDSDDGYFPAIVAILNDHGWFHTVYRWVNGKRVLVEPWHFEYDASRDNHRHEGAPASTTTSKPITSPETPRRSTMELKIDTAGNVRLFTDNGDVQITSITVRNLLIRHRNQSFEPIKFDANGNPVLPQFHSIELDLIAAAIRAADDGSAANLAALNELSAAYERQS